MKSGMNRTGLLVSPELAQELIEGVEQWSPAPQLDDTSSAAIRALYIEEGDTIGSKPEGDEDGLMDKLGARLAFERSGVRLYDALIQKRTAVSGSTHPTIKELEHIRAEELQHLLLLQRCIEELGGDPTTLTPAADIGATMTVGVMQVVLDPRTTIDQCLEAILTAELVDNDCWSVLIDLVREKGQEEMLESFEAALAEEEEHLTDVRAWIRRSAGLTA